MIFVTVGTQLPFPRLIGAMDALAPTLQEPVIAQTGPSPEATWTHLDVRPHLEPAEFGALFTAARVIVAHAGVGTILSAKRYGRPLIILPRRHALGEHRNDHQLATARQMDGQPGIHVAWETGDLAALLADPALTPADERPGPSREALIRRLRTFIDG